jgi:hypothetical protein
LEGRVQKGNQSAGNRRAGAVAAIVDGEELAGEHRKGHMGLGLTRGRHGGGLRALEEQRTATMAAAGFLCVGEIQNSSARQNYVWILFLFIYLYIHHVCIRMLRFEILKTRKGVTKGK